MNVTDNELCMLEQLTYLSGPVAQAANGVPYDAKTDITSGMTVGELLERFDEESLDALERYPKLVQNASGKEWADIIRYLKNSDLRNLKIKETFRQKGTDDIIALTFVEEGNETDAIVAFRGTHGSDEWVDNVEAMNKAESPCQIEAYDFIESLPYENITVTGHSKGANKAMYVTVRSNKIKRCVCFDGQGFSKEFQEKYWAEIEKKGGLITNYALGTDFVHILMYPVPNSTQIYCQGHGVANAGENHSPNSFFATDKDGNMLIDENGQPIIIQVPENESMTMLHGFVNFILNNASEEDKKIIVEFVGPLLALSTTGLGGLNKEEIIKTILSYIEQNQEGFVVVVAYLVKYADTYHLTTEDVQQLLNAFGLGMIGTMLGAVIGPVFEQLIGQLTDNNDDKIITTILNSTLGKLTDMDISAVWTRIDDKIDCIDTSGGRENMPPRTGQIRDFSNTVYEALMNSIYKIENLGISSVSEWEQYGNEEWYFKIFVHAAVKAINAYFNKISETNQVCRRRIDKVFNNVEDIDKVVSGTMRSRNEELESAKIFLTSLAETIM